MRFWLTDLRPRDRSLYGNRSSRSKSIGKCVRLIEAIVPSFCFFSRLKGTVEDCDCDSDCGVRDREVCREDACDCDTGVGDFVRVEIWLSRDGNPRVPYKYFVVGLRTR